MVRVCLHALFFFNDTATTEIYTLSLHDALPICRVVQAARGAGVERFVHMSAVRARDDPDATPYHRTKWHGEELVRTSGLSHAVFRPSIISGPESPPIRTLARLHRWSPAVPVFGDGRFPTQPVWVEDVALAFALAVEQPALVGAF